jgi:hypothetical protein
MIVFNKKISRHYTPHGCLTCSRKLILNVNFMIKERYNLLQVSPVISGKQRQGLNT